MKSLSISNNNTKKNNNKLVLIALLFNFTFNFYININSISSQINLAFIPNNILENFLKPIEFSLPGLKFYIENTFNKKEYSSMILPYEFEHFIQLISQSHKTANPKLYCKTLIELWREKYKEVFYVDARAVIKLLEEISLVTNNIFIINNLETRKQAIFQCLLNNLATNNSFEKIKEDPEKFLNILAQEILEIADSTDYFTDFLESIINKILWSSADRDIVFEIFEKLDQLIYNIHIKSIIDEEGFYRLSNSLICRLKYHIEIAGDELSPIFYLKALKSIEDNKLHLLILEEIEDNIKTRATLLKEILLEGQMLSKTQQNFKIISSPIIY